MMVSVCMCGSSKADPIFLSLADAVPFMVIVTDNVAENVAGGTINVCVDPGVAGDIEVQLAVVLTASENKASKL